AAHEESARDRGRAATRAAAAGAPLDLLEGLGDRRQVAGELRRGDDLDLGGAAIASVGASLGLFPLLARLLRFAGALVHRVVAATHDTPRARQGPLSVRQQMFTSCNESSIPLRYE